MKKITALLLMVAAAPGVSFAQNITSGLVAHYTFESTPTDISGNGNHATPAGLYQYVSGGLVGGGIRLSGDQSLFYSGGGHVLLPTLSTAMNTGFTVSLWAKDEVLGGQPSVEEMYVSFGIVDEPTFGISYNSETRQVLYYLNGSIGSGIGKNVSKTLSVPADLAAWKHLVFTYTPGKLAAYFNGVKIGEQSITVNVFPVTKAALGRHWWSGGSGSSARMSVTLDNVRIYNRALTDLDVQQLNATDPLPVTPLPAITTQPVAQTVIEQQGTTFRVVAASNVPLFYQWRKNDVPISGALDSTYVIPAVKASDAGTYSVAVTNTAGTVVSSGAVLTTKSNDPGRLSNVSIRAVVNAADSTLIAGLNVTGQAPVTVLIRGIGPTLALYNVTDPLPDPKITIYRGQTAIATNDNWSAGGIGTMPNSAASVGAFPLPPGSLDAAMIVILTPGGYTIHLTSSGPGTGSALIEVYEVP